MDEKLFARLTASMNQMNEITEGTEAARKLVAAIPFLGRNVNRQDYLSALQLAEHLVEHDPDNPLIDFLTLKIDRYENDSPEFADFNSRTGSATIKN